MTNSTTTWRAAKDGPEHVDTVVIGGGAIGCAVAWWRAADSDRVVLLERNQIGSGASFGNAGHLTPSDAWPLSAPGVVREALGWTLRREAPFALQWRFKRDYLAWLAAFARWSHRSLSARIVGLWDLGSLSLDLLRDMASQTADSPILQDRGVLNAYTTRAGLTGGERMADHLARHGVPSQVLSSSAAADMSGYRGALAGGVLFTQDALCSPFQYVSWLARGARDRGVDIRAGIAVESVRSEGDRVRVCTNAGILLAEAVVLAAGPQTPQLARSFGQKVPIIGGQGYSLDAMLEPAPTLPLLFPEWRIAASPLDGVVRFAGLMDLATAPRPAKPRRARYLEHTAREAFSYAKRFEPRAAWTGVRACTHDGLPIIDALDPSGRVVIAAGHNMLGMTLAAGTGYLVAKRIAGERSTIDERPFALGRFRARRGRWS